MSKTTRDEQNAAQSSENLGAEQGAQEQSAASTQAQGAQTSQSGAAQSMQAQITPLPTPPTSADSASFNERADNFLLALPRFANELNAFGQAVGEETKERIESTIKSSIDTHLNENEVRLKKELVDEVASQTSGLKRASVRLLNIPCYDYTDFNTPKGLAGLNYQLVTRQNDEQHDSEIVDYGDVFVSVYLNYNKNAFRGITRLLLPRTVGELENYHIRTNEGRTVANYTDPQNAGETHIDGAVTKDVIEGDTLEIIKSAAGISGAVSMSATMGVCEWVKDEDKNEYKFSYRAHLINEPRKDVITLKLGSNEKKINIFIKKRAHTLTKEQKTQRCQWSKVEGNGQDFICWCEQMSDTVLVFGHNFWLTGGIGSSNRYIVLTSCYNHGLKFSFPCEVAEIYAPFNCVMVLLKDGSLWHLGNNQNYEAGLGNTAQVQYFTKNPTLKKVKRLFFSQDFVPTNLGTTSQTNTPKSVNFFALCEENKLYAWGANTSGCLGLGDTSVKTTPQLVNVSWEVQIKDICAFANFTHLLLENGKLLRAGLTNHTKVVSVNYGINNYSTFNDPNFNPMLYHPKVWKWYKGNDYEEFYNGVKGLWQAGADQTQTKAFEKVKAIFKNCTQNNLYNWALQLESGELCYDIYSFGLNYADNENWQDSPPYRPTKNFGWGKDLGMSEICDVQTAGRVLAFARKDNTKLYFVRWGQRAPVAQSLGEFGGGDLSYDYKYIDFGLKNELLQWQITTAPNPAISCFVIKNKEMGRDDLLIFNGDCVFHKVAY